MVAEEQNHSYASLIIQATSLFLTFGSVELQLQHH